MTHDSIEFTPAKFKAFKEAYTAAEKEGKKTFSFDNKAFVTNYAKYLIEYLAPKFNKR